MMHAGRNGTRLEHRKNRWPSGVRSAAAIPVQGIMGQKPCERPGDSLRGVSPDADEDACVRSVMSLPFAIAQGGDYMDRPRPQVMPLDARRLA